MEAVQKDAPLAEWSTAQLIARLTDFVATHPIPAQATTEVKTKPTLKSVVSL